ncbi:MAG TPA: hypothetical protein VFF52_09440 [Isosphaeraceae bacterium]|nr:hypothetical protein [Isosphaeraceae bacterium]
MHRSSSRPNSIPPDFDHLELPPSLERIGRAIRVAGHRISLVQVLDAIFDGISTERMREMFPTIPAWKLDEVFAFCERNIGLMRRYSQEQRAAFAAGEVGRSGEAPTLAELRRRKTERNGPETRDG